MNPWWVTGLVDGEGCFYASFGTRDRVTEAGNSVSCSNFDIGLQIQMRDDDWAMLDGVREFFGCGSILEKPVTASRLNGANPACSFRVNKLEDVVGVIIPHFTKYPLQSKKANDFEIWASLVTFVNENLAGKKGWIRRFPEQVNNVVNMCDRLKQVRKYRKVSHG